MLFYLRFEEMLFMSLDIRYKIEEFLMGRTEKYG